jgi:hypothetical protein
MIASRALTLVALVTLLVGNGPSALAQTAAPSAEKTKKQALEWLDSFARFQVLFSADDVKSLRDRVASMSPDEAAAWWEKTTPQRKLLSSPEWSETENWLRKFLNVQARYNDDEIRYFQTEAATKAKDSAGSLQEVLDRVTKARRKLIAGSQASEDVRQMQLAANEAYRQQEVRRREEARRQASAQPAATFPAPPTVRQYPAGYNAPLIDSIDVARWAVLRELYPRW